MKSARRIFRGSRGHSTTAKYLLGQDDGIPLPRGQTQYRESGNAQVKMFSTFKPTALPSMFTQHFFRSGSFPGPWWYTAYLTYVWCNLKPSNYTLRRNSTRAISWCDSCASFISASRVECNCGQGLVKQFSSRCPGQLGLALISFEIW